MCEINLNLMFYPVIEHLGDRASCQLLRVPPWRVITLLKKTFFTIHGTTQASAHDHNEIRLIKN